MVQISLQLQPEDWDDEEDGEWTAPTIPNPEYKGPWKAKVCGNQLTFSGIDKIDGLLTATLSISRNLRTPTIRASGRHQ